MQLKIVRAEVVDGDSADFTLVGEPRILLVDRKLDTYATLKRQVLDSYFPEQGWNPEEYRLRAFNVQFDIMLDTYEDREDLTLEQLKIYPMKTLALEHRKNVEQPWEVYDPTKMTIKIVTWRKEIVATNDESMQKKVKVPKHQLLSDFKSQMESQFGLSDAVCMRRTPLNQLKPVDILTEQENLGKGLNELRVSEGSVVYVEERTEGIITKWETEFELETNRYQIKYNLLLEEDQSKFSDQIYTEVLLIDRRSSVLQLKEAICEKIGQGLDQIVFRRGGANGAELVDDDLPFKQANIYNMMSVFIERGQPTRQGWKRLKVFIAEYYNPDWQTFFQATNPTELKEPHDNEFFTFEEVGKFPIKVVDAVKSVK